MIYNLNHNPYIPFDSLLPDGKYYYVDCPMSTYHSIPDLIKYKSICDENNYTLMIDNSYEGWKSLVDIIYETLVIPYNWNPNNICLVSGDADVEKYVRYVAAKHNKNEIKSLWARRFEYMIATQTHCNVHKFADKYSTWHDREHRHFNKTFLNLNRRWRFHRPLLVILLALENLLEKGYVSLNQADYNQSWEEVLPVLLYIHKNDTLLHSKILNNQDFIKKIPKLSLDRESLHETTLFNLEERLNSFYQDSLLSVVTETNFYAQYTQTITYEGTRFLSEKTFKPIAHQHPFMLVSTPNMLELLRDIGYKTFHPYIDETYDGITNDGDRLLYIIKELKRLSNLSKQEQKEFVEKTIPICAYNYQILLSRSQLQV